jgi:hypothetical protein
LLQVVVERHRAAAVGAAVGGMTDLGAMAADGGQFERLEDEVDVGERAPAHQGEGAVGVLLQPFQRAPQGRRNAHVMRRGREVEQRSVNIEQNRRFANIDRFSLHVVYSARDLVQNRWRGNTLL